MGSFAVDSSTVASVAGFGAGHDSTGLVSSCETFSAPAGVEVAGAVSS